MAKLPSLFLTISTATALCVTGFISVQNLAAQVYNMLGGYHQPFWDAVWVGPGIRLSLAFVAVFGVVFYTMSYCAIRYHLLTRNHVLTILAGIILFIFFSEYLETTDVGWAG